MPEKTSNISEEPAATHIHATIPIHTPNQHRDTTLASLTAVPALVDGRITYEDSPLVRAVKHGRVLVVDEADKAPVEVCVCVCVFRVSVCAPACVSMHRMVINRDGRCRVHTCEYMFMHMSIHTQVVMVLKGLLEDGFLLLGDGRRVVASAEGVGGNGKVVPIHPEFRMIALANRPGVCVCGWFR